MADYIWIRERPWKKRSDTQKSAYVQTAPEKIGAEDKGDLYLEPEECVPLRFNDSKVLTHPSSSFLIQVKAADITPSG